jgi:gluconate 2-dehydrogenase gamma chain
MDSKLLQILDSSRVSSPTRKVLNSRLEAVQKQSSLQAKPYEPKAITPAAFAVLEHMIARLLLEDVHEGVDSYEVGQPSHVIAMQLEESRATGKGNGWRYGTLPSDAEALSQGLDLLEKTAMAEHQASFIQLSTDQQEMLLARVQHGKVHWPGFDSVRWFEEVLADATELYISHPGRMLQLGIDAFADDPDGWSEIGLNNTQSWEPEAPLPATGTEGRRR